MQAVNLTDQQIQNLIVVPKMVTNTRARERINGKVITRDYELTAHGGLSFSVFIRSMPEMADNFSTGLVWHPPGGGHVILMRCNGPSHPHKNHLEGDGFANSCHVHIATQRYIAAGRDKQSYAQMTDAYWTVDGALHELVTRCSISGLETRPDEDDLFRNMHD